MVTRNFGGHFNLVSSLLNCTSSFLYVAIYSFTGIITNVVNVVIVTGFTDGLG